MRILDLPTRWMFYIALERSRIRSKKTWKSYAEWLLDWLRHCEANDWENLLEIGEGHLGAYRRHMLRTKSVHDDPFAVATINARLNTVARMYEWMHRKGFIPTYPFSAEATRFRSEDEGLLGFARRTPQQRRSITLPMRKRIPKAVPREAIMALRQLLSLRDQIIVDWALVTGMRQAEILALDVRDLPDVSIVRNISKVEMEITKTKGLYPRTVLVPLKLLDRTWRYIHAERAAIRNTTRKTHSDEAAVFLSENSGRRLSSKTLWRHFHEAVQSCGMTVRFHDLRHTYAIHRLLTLEAAKRENPSLPFVPILKLKENLGHHSLASTQIYVKAMAQDTSAIEQSLVTYLDEVA